MAAPHPQATLLAEPPYSAYPATVNANIDSLAVVAGAVLDRLVDSHLLPFGHHRRRIACRREVLQEVVDAGGVLGSPSWSPDGKKIVFPSVDKGGRSDLFIVDLGSRELTRFTNDMYEVVIQPGPLMGRQSSLHPTARRTAKRVP